MTLSLQKYATGLSRLFSWLLLGTLALTPLIYGGTNPAHVFYISILILFLTACWGFALFFGGRSIHLHPLMLLLAGLLLFQGWFMFWNAHSSFDLTYREFMPIQNPWPGKPGAADRILARDFMLRFTSLFALLFFICHYCSRSKRRAEHIIRIIAVSALAVVLLGMLQKTTGARTIYWGERQLNPFFFGTFLYHGNAGAFLNLTWPLTAYCFAVLWDGSRSLKRNLARQFWSIALLLHTLALFLHGSRLASFLSVLMILIWVLTNRRFLISRIPRHRGVWISATLVILAASALLVATSMSRSFSRWLEFFRFNALGQRFDAYQASIPLIQEAGWLGFGPGAFKWVFTHHIKVTAAEIPIFWRHLHQDYLHTVIDWGWLGTLLWTATTGCAVWLGIRAWRAATDRHSRILFRSLFLGLGITFTHALLDFPLQIYSIQLITFACFGIFCGRWLMLRRPKSKSV